MLSALDGLEAWANDWQQRDWTIRTVVPALGATLRFYPGGYGLLGVALREYLAIGVSDRVAGSTLELPVVLHEAAHLLTTPQPVGLCEGTWPLAEGERLAWLGAGRLAVSRALAEAWSRGELPIDELAERQELPAGLLAVGLAVHGRRGRLPRLQPPAPAAALVAWQQDLARALRAYRDFLCPPRFGPANPGSRPRRFRRIA